MWKKILYFSIAVILGMVFYVVVYAANLSDYKLELVNTAIQNEDYHIIPQLFLEVPFDTKSIVEENDFDAEVKVYPASGLTNYAIVEGETTKSYARYENAYLFFIFKISFPISGYVDSGNNNVNPSAIQFIGEKGTYNLYLVQNSTYNSNSYIASPKNEYENSLNCSRDVVSVYSDWGFMPISLSETTIKGIEEVTGKVEAFKIIDSMGEVKIEENIKFTFEEEFFKNSYIYENKNTVDQMLTKYYDENDTSDKNDLAEQINNKLEDFRKKFAENTKDTSYAITLPEEVITPNSIYWKTIAYLGLYLVLVIIFYFVLFHFKQIVEFVKGLNNRNNNNNKTQKGPKKTGPYVVKKDPVSPKKIETEEK